MVIADKHKIKLSAHTNYTLLIEKAKASHAQGRSPRGISDEEIALARLYCYAFRRHTIGAFHATCDKLEQQVESSNEVARVHRQNATAMLTDLANQSMDPVPENFRALISTLYRYDILIHRVIEALCEDAATSGNNEVERLSKRFIEVMNAIRNCNGIELTRDNEVPEQASFVVPNLGITIAPLVYGDYHSWNLAWLGDVERCDVPTHLHHEGVEIHLGYNPMRGKTILGDSYALLEEGYAMPIPPETRHGYVNDSPHMHNVPFIFGSLKHGGWGVFLDVEPKPFDFKEMNEVRVQSRQMNQTIFLEREIEKAAQRHGNCHYRLIPASATARDGVGGLELCVGRTGSGGMTRKENYFNAVSIVRGSGIIKMAGIEQAIEAHDHFGVPSGIQATLIATGKEPLIFLDCQIKPDGDL
jgi:mannose-6-phosphate isomerase-like protein (cupin superfamily)